MSFLCGEANARSEGTCKTLEIRRPSSLISVRSSCAADPATTVSLTDYQPSGSHMTHVRSIYALCSRKLFVPI